MSKISRELRIGLSGLLCGAALLVAGCTTPDIQRPKVLNMMIGQSPLDLVRRFGVPTRTYQTQGHNFLSYIETDTQYSPGTSGWGWGWGGYGFGGLGMSGWGWGGGDIPPSYYSATCQTTFEVMSDKVLGWRMHGDGC